MDSKYVNAHTGSNIFVSTNRGLKNYTSRIFSTVFHWSLSAPIENIRNLMFSGGIERDQVAWDGLIHWRVIESHSRSRDWMSETSLSFCSLENVCSEI